MTRPLYRCHVCGATQPGDALLDDAAEVDDPPDELRNVTCRHKFGGCCRMASMERVEGREWEPVYWELFCLPCGYETVAWGTEGFGDTTRWACPDCGDGMQVLSVEQAWE